MFALQRKNDDYIIFKCSQCKKSVKHDALQQDLIIYYQTCDGCVHCSAMMMVLMIDMTMMLLLLMMVVVMMMNNGAADDDCGGKDGGDDGGDVEK